MKTKEEIEQEAKKRYPENISLEGSDSNKKQRKNQRIFIEGADFANQSKWIDSINFAKWVSSKNYYYSETHGVWWKMYKGQPEQVASISENLYAIYLDDIKQKSTPPINQPKP